MNKEEKFKNKFRVRSARYPHWDYSQDGYYFVTICTEGKEYYFGEVVNGWMRYSEIGKIAYKYWEDIPHHFPFVNLCEFIIMPNHLHGIVEIFNGRDAKFCVSTNDEYHNKFGPQSKNLSSIIRGYKAGVKKYAKINNINFYWQAKFYDHIIWHENELNKIRTYIIENPEKWELDKNNPANLYM